jgi:hypothetical protein
VGHDVTATPGWYRDPASTERLRWWDGNAWTSHVAASPVAPCTAAAGPQQGGGLAAAGGEQGSAAELRAQVAELTRRRDALQSQIVETGDRALLQEVGLYAYSHPLDSSAQYSDALGTLQEEMKRNVKENRAVVGTKKWAINGSEADGARMVADLSKLMLRAYNTEADNVMRTLKPHALRTAIERLQKMRASISRLGISMKIEVTDGYHALRVKELKLTADYLAKVAEERERERDERARLKEEAIARREYEREQAKLEKERAHHEAALNALRMKGDAAGVEGLTQKLAEVQRAIDGLVSRSANIRAGYVYVISNCGAFGDGVVKIGMTRRLDPMERVRELGDASVPFRYDVHLILFSDDAVGLEGALHDRFSRTRVNCVNMRREFFYATPHDVKGALVELNANLLTFVEVAEALEWRQSQGELRRRATGGGVEEVTDEPPADAGGPPPVTAS